MIRNQEVGGSTPPRSIFSLFANFFMGRPPPRIVAGGRPNRIKPMHRFFCPQLKLTTYQIDLTDSKEIHHLKDVLRLKEDDCVVLFNGKGGEADGIITSITPHAVKFLVKAVRKSLKQSISIIMACAIPKKAKFEFIIEKLTELGVDEIIPLKTTRTEFKMSAEHIQKKYQRFEKIVINAAKQSGRVTIPKIHPVIPFKDVLQICRQPQTLAVIPCLQGSRRHLNNALNQARKNFSKIIILIGPEGDFTPEEVQQAIEIGCIPVTLGKNVLKVDTAAIVTAAFANLFISP